MSGVTTLENTTSVSVVFNGTLSDLTPEQQAALRSQGNDGVVNNLPGVSINDIMDTTLQSGSVILTVTFFPFRVTEVEATSAAATLEGTPLEIDLGDGARIASGAASASVVEVVFDVDRSGGELQTLSATEFENVTQVRPLGAPYGVLVRVCARGRVCVAKLD